jgi:hypothetical protein
MSRVAILLLISLAWVSCGKKNTLPPGILKPEQMQGVLWDVIRADAFVATRKTADSINTVTRRDISLQKQVLALHQVSRETFVNSFNYYKLHPEQFLVIMDSLISKGGREKYNRIGIQNK